MSFALLVGVLSALLVFVQHREPVSLPSPLKKRPSMRVLVEHTS